MSRRTDQAINEFDRGFSCSQAVLAAFSEELGLDRNTALKISQPFGGGMAQRGETCGAVTGAYMVIGLKHGRTQPEDTAARDRTYALMREFIDRFTNAHGTLQCRELLGYKLDDPADHARAEEAGQFRDLCPRLVGSAADILEDLLSRP
ncbi:MAG: C-GCAxxG-C-C family protein [Candidatus Aminicenantaceae bacterium]